MDAETKLLAVLSILEYAPRDGKGNIKAGVDKAVHGILKGDFDEPNNAKSFTYKDPTTYHGPNPPQPPEGSHWVPTAPGPKGGVNFVLQSGAAKPAEKPKEQPKQDTQQPSLLDAAKSPSGNDGLYVAMRISVKDIIRSDNPKDAAISDKGKFTANEKTKRLVKERIAAELTKTVDASSDKETRDNADALLDEFGFEVDVSWNGGVEGAMALLVSKWADTSNDHDPLARAIQERAEEVFKIKPKFRYDQVGFKDQQFRSKTDEVREKFEPIIDAYLRATYKNTQDYFKANGITEVVLYRGVGLEGKDKLTSVEFKDEFDAALQPLSSFSTDYGIAAGFAFHAGKPVNMVIGTKVPVEKIFSSCLTGAGCFPEAEFIVASDSIKANAALWSHIAHEPTYEKFHERQR